MSRHHFFYHFSNFFEPSWPPGRLLGASWRHLGTTWGDFGPSWGRLGASWRVLGRLGGVLEASWGVLEASWAQNPPNINLTRRGTGSAVF